MFTKSQVFLMVNLLFCSNVQALRFEVNGHQINTDITSEQKLAAFVAAQKEDLNKRFEDLLFALEETSRSNERKQAIKEYLQESYNKRISFFDSLTVDSVIRVTMQMHCQNCCSHAKDQVCGSQAHDTHQ